MPESATNAWNEVYATLAAEMMPYGPALPDGSLIEIAQAFSTFEAEYAAIRQRVGVMHLPQRAILHLTGADVKDYLHRLCTQEINGLDGGASVRAFQLNEKGHIAADLIVHHGDESTWLEMDVFDLPWVRDLLEQRMFTEDVTIEDWTDQRTFLWLLGPAAVRLMSAVAGADGVDAVERMGSMPGTHHVIDLPLNGGGAAHATAYRWDLGGVLGVRLAVPSEHAVEVYGALLAKSGFEPGGDARASGGDDAEYAERRRASMRGRPVGWSAFNTVRIEEGVPWYHIDFGGDSLPAEVPGLHGLDGAVSFTKGCYLGQEIVARMKSLGHPKKLLVGIRVRPEHPDPAGLPATPHSPEAPPEMPPEASTPQNPREGDEITGDGPNTFLPIAGAQVFDANEKQKLIGGVTSSTASPLRGQAGIGFAVVRWGRHQAGTAVRVPADGRLIDAEVAALDALVGG